MNYKYTCVVWIHQTKKGGRGWPDANFCFSFKTSTTRETTTKMRPVSAKYQQLTAAEDDDNNNQQMAFYEQPKKSIHSSSSFSSSMMDTLSDSGKNAICRSHISLSFSASMDFTQFVHWLVPLRQMTRTRGWTGSRAGCASAPSAPVGSSTGTRSVRDISGRICVKQE